MAYVTEDLDFIMPRRSQRQAAPAPVAEPLTASPASELLMYRKRPSPMEWDDSMEEEERQLKRLESSDQRLERDVTDLLFVRRRKREASSGDSNVERPHQRLMLRHVPENYREIVDLDLGNGDKVNITGCYVQQYIQSTFDHPYNPNPLKQTLPPKPKTPATQTVKRKSMTMVDGVMVCKF